MIENELSATNGGRQVSRHAVRNHIARMVLTSELAPGEKVVQQDLAKKLGVSRGVVREALFELGGMGLIDNHDNRGGVVSPLCGEFILEALEVRELLEGLVARRCCSRVTRAQIAELREVSQEIYRLSSEERRVEAALLDRQLHLKLMQYSGNSVQIRMSESFWFATKVMRNDSRNHLETLRSHLEVLDAIESGDEELAERVMRSHIRDGRENLEAALKAPTNQIHWVIDPIGDVDLPFNERTTSPAEEVRDTKISPSPEKVRSAKKKKIK